MLAFPFYLGKFQGIARPLVRPPRVAVKRIKILSKRLLLAQVWKGCGLPRPVVDLLGKTLTYTARSAGIDPAATLS